MATSSNRHLDLSQAAFSFGDRSYSYGHLVLAGIVSGRWQGFRARAATEVARGADLDARLASRARAVAEEFRRDRGLESAADLRAWLEARGLTGDDLATHCRARARPAPPDLPSPGTDEEVGPGWWASACCGGDLARWAEDLVAWACAAHLAPGGPSGGGPPPVGEALLAEAGRSPAAPLFPGTSLAPALAELAALRAAHRGLAVSVADDGAALAGHLTRRVLAWTRLIYDELAVETEHQAREALLCLRHEEEAPDDLAVRIGATLTRHDRRHEDCDPDVAALLAGLDAGGAGGPHCSDGRSLVLVLVERRRPTLEDPQIRRRVVEEVLADRLDRVATGRIRWLGPL